MNDVQPNLVSGSVRIASNAIKARLFDADREIKLIVSEALSYQVQGADHSEAFKTKRWDGRSTFFDFNSGAFPAGFVPLVAQHLRSLGVRVLTLAKGLPPVLGTEVGTQDYLGYGFADRYDYQPETVRRLLANGRMIARVATGGGKSQIAVLAAGTIRRPTMFLTTRTVLAHQMATTFEKAGMTPGFMGDGLWAPRKGVNIAMVQTLASRLAAKHPERDKTIQLLKYFEFVIGEEAHEAGGSEYFDIMQACENAHYRLALTATPFMRGDEEANMRLMGCFGPIGIEISEELLISRGILARPIFKFADAPGTSMIRRGTKWPTCYEIGVVENPERNRMIVQEVHRASSHGLPTMVLIQRKKHGEILRKSLVEAGVRAEFIFGAHEATERSAALKRLGNGETQALIGSTILDVGVDVPAVGLVALAGGGKAEVAHRQRIGRGLREKKSGPNVCHILDFSDRFNNTLMMHGVARRAIVEQTPGFRENILHQGGDYDYGCFIGS